MCVCVQIWFPEQFIGISFSIENSFDTVSWAKNCTMPFTVEKDAEFGDAHFDVSKYEKRLVRATIKTYEKTGIYICIKLFKKAERDYEFHKK